jgi:hypothetical protein
MASVMPIQPDEDGYVGRECPIKECLGYFKISPCTGIQRPRPVLLSVLRPQRQEQYVFHPGADRLRSLRRYPQGYRCGPR